MITKVVAYKFKRHNKINGTLFYCAEYSMISKLPFYIIDISEKDLLLVKKVFLEKYKNEVDIITISVIDFAKLRPVALILDVLTYESIYYFTKKAYCFTNHFLKHKRDGDEFYGSYSYQNFDKFCYLKLGFSEFKQAPLKEERSLFISCLDFRKSNYIIPKNAYCKASNKHIDNLFKVSRILYLHVDLDTNNRIIPEAFFHNTPVTYIDEIDLVDSIQLRYDDIIKNGLSNYTLDESDIMIQDIKEYNEL